MATTIKLKNSVTATAAPSSLVQGEVAANITDKKVWIGDASSSPVQILGAGAPVSGTTGTFTGNTTVAGTFAANGGATLGDASGDALTINSSAVSIPNGLNFDSNTLVIDATNNRVGVGTASPTQALSLSLSDLGGISYGDRTFTGTYYLGTTSGAGNAFGGNSTYIGFAGSGTSAADIIIQPNAGNTIFRTGSATEVMRLNSSGNLGLGVTPSAWGSGWVASQVSGGGAAIAGRSTNPELYLTSNAHYNGTNWIYKTSNFATYYAQDGKEHKWYQANSGTAGNAISFTQAMTLDASGNLGIGTTSPGYRLTVDGGYAALRSGNGVTFLNPSNNSTSDITNGASSGSADLRFGTAGSERMRIDSSGNLLVGTTAISSSNLNGFAARPYAGGIFLEVCHNTSASSGDSYVDFRRNGTVIGTISQNGTTAVAYNTTSDYRLKDSQAPLTGSGAFIDALQPKTWTWKADGSTGVGFIAHEVQAVSPDSVVGEKDAVDEEGNPKYQAMEYGSAEFIANIIAELQDLRKRVAVLESK